MGAVSFRLESSVPGWEQFVVLVTTWEQSALGWELTLGAVSAKLGANLGSSLARLGANLGSSHCQAGS